MLSAAWPNHFDPKKGIDFGAAVQAYHVALADLPYGAAAAAAGRAIREGKFFPTPAELRAAVLADRAGAWTPERAHARYDLGRCSVCGKPAELVMDGHRRYCGDHGDVGMLAPPLRPLPAAEVARVG